MDNRTNDEIGNYEKKPIKEVIKKAFNRVELITVWIIFAILLILNTLHWYAKLIPLEPLISISIILVLGTLSILITYLVTQEIEREEDNKYADKREKELDEINKEILIQCQSIKAATIRLPHLLSIMEYIAKESDPIFRKVGLNSVETIKEFTASISEGVVKYNYPQYREIIIESVSLAKKNVKATHYCCRQELLIMWKMDLVQRNYLAANFQCVERDIVFERLFIINNLMLHEEVTCKMILEVFDEQEKGGIIVFVLFEEDYGQRWEEDLVIIDRKIMHLYQRGKELLFDYITLVINKQKIEKHTDLYDGAKLRASPWKKIRPKILNNLNSKDGLCFSIK